MTRWNSGTATRNGAVLGALVALTTLATTTGAASAAARPATTAPTTAAVRPAATTPSCNPLVAFDRRQFSYPTTIDNIWLPQVPGTQFVLNGQANRGGGMLPHQVILTVTGLTKVIDGVPTRVIWDRDIHEGTLSEAELAFFAQDNTGNIWTMGEYPEEYDSNGNFVGAPNTWIPGQADARAGLAMLADPKVGTPRYLQGSAPAIDFLDCAQVFKRGQRVCVPLDCYKNVLITDEDSPLDPAGGHQRKFYAPGVGNIKITPVNDPEGETLVLVGVNQLSKQALADANTAARDLEKRAYRVSGVYRHTPPMRG
ncbi:MAG TPA: hypothetical protein VGP31_17115 [Planosporangium sp.]|jgi:hypothetical protein|nr:hypothetical protein [Planosporangium sp.]